MKYLELQIVSWDNSCYVPLNGEDNNYKSGDRVLLECEWGKEAAEVVAIRELEQVASEQLAVAIEGRLDKEWQSRQQELLLDENKALKFCHNRVREMKLPMKLVNAHFSLDKKRLVFAFIAQGRVDFRNLLKDLTKEFNSNIRLQQIGVRDEAKINGDVGPCGFRLCCQSHLRSLGNVTTEMAQKQQVAQRGADRLSGACGRLKCCLAYEDGRNN